MEKSAVTQPSNQELLMFANQAEPEGLLTHRRAAGFHEKITQQYQREHIFEVNGSNQQWQIIRSFTI